MEVSKAVSPDDELGLIDTEFDDRDVCDGTEEAVLRDWLDVVMEADIAVRDRVIELGIVELVERVELAGRMEEDLELELGGNGATKLQYHKSLR